MLKSVWSISLTFTWPEVKSSLTIHSPSEDQRICLSVLRAFLCLADYCVFYLVKKKRFTMSLELCSYNNYYIEIWSTSKWALLCLMTKRRSCSQCKQCCNFLLSRNEIFHMQLILYLKIRPTGLQNHQLTDCWQHKKCWAVFVLATEVMCATFRTL